MVWVSCLEAGALPGLLNYPAGISWVFFSPTGMPCVLWPKDTQSRSSEAKLVLVYDSSLEISDGATNVVVEVTHG